MAAAGRAAAEHQMKTLMMAAKTITWPLRVLEEHHKDKPWQSAPGTVVDLATGIVTLDLNEWLDMVIMADKKTYSNDTDWGYMGLPDPADSKTQEKPATCSWPTYKDYLGLSESFKFCEKCGKKEKDHA